MRKKLAAGFTLIEIMFVIAIIAVIAALSITLYQQTTVTAKVSKTALQMQQILQAGSAYYIANQSESPPWPTSITQSSFQSYLPVGSTESPWGTSYTAASPQVGGAPNNNLFQVQVTAPSAAIADRIAGQLPSSQVTGSTVTSEVGKPGQSMISKPAPPAFTIMKMGMGTSGPALSTFINFTCPSDTNACVYTATAEVHNKYTGGRKGKNLPTNNMSDIVTYCDGQTSSQGNSVACFLTTKMCGSSYYNTITGSNAFRRQDISEPSINAVAFYVGVCQTTPCSIVTPDSGDPVQCTTGNTTPI